jgi:hypothetical protein
VARPRLCGLSQALKVPRRGGYCWMGRT